MGAALGWNRYGKSRVRVMKVDRSKERHTVRELDVAIGLEGAFEEAHTRGDNTRVLPTDTMKNTVYALAKDDPIRTIEEFALRLGRHFVSSVPHVDRSRVEIVERVWRRLEAGGAEHPHTFAGAGPETPACVIDVGREGERVRSSLRDLVILKTARSGFSDFLHDKFTTLADTDDRLLGTSLSAEWDCRGADFGAVRTTVRTALLDAFASHDSLSVQHTLYAMGEAALAACPDIAEITLSMPNKHCLLVDLSPFNLANDNEVFLPIDEPHGLIEATVRAGS